EAAAMEDPATALTHFPTAVRAELTVDCFEQVAMAASWLAQFWQLRMIAACPHAVRAASSFWLQPASESWLTVVDDRRPADAVSPAAAIVSERAAAIEISGLIPISVRSFVFARVTSKLGMRASGTPRGSPAGHRSSRA